jgi:hypothetical protein
MGLFCSDCSRKGGVLFQWVFRYLRELVQKSLDVCVHTAKCAFSSRHWQFINWDPRHFLLEYFADTVSTHLFLFPNHLSLPIRKREILDSQKEKMCCFPPKWLFVSDFLGFLRSKNLAWWPLNFRSPKALLLEKPSALNKERGRRKPLDVFTTKCCCPHPIVWQGHWGHYFGSKGPPHPHPKKCTTWVFSFFLFSHLFKGEKSSFRQWDHHQHKTRQPRGMFCSSAPPLTRKRGNQPFREKETRKEKRE